MEDVKSANLLLDHLEQRDNDSYILFDASPRISFHIDSRILNRLITKGVIINANEDEIGFLSDRETLEEKTSDVLEKLTNQFLLL